MDIKEFIEECVSSILKAAISLQEEHAKSGALINPPSDHKGDNTLLADDRGYVYRRVQNVDFDLAVTISSTTGGEAKGGVKIFSAEAGAAASHSRQNEQVSRIRFSIPIALPPSQLETENRSKEQPRPTYSRVPVA